MDQTRTERRRRALVTGGSRGIGAAVVDLFRRRGVEVLAPTRAELDLADPASIARYARSAPGAGVDILVNNAGINIVNAVPSIRDADFAAMLQVNVTAALKLIQAFAPPMAEAKWGRIVNVSSIFSLVTRERRAAYSATKSALNGLTRAAAVELAPSGVLVNAVCPGYVKTELTTQNNSPSDIDAIAATIPCRRLAEPAEIAAVIAFLCGEENGYVTGQTIVADGGFLCL